MIGQLLWRELANISLFLTMLALVLLVGGYLLGEIKHTPRWRHEVRNKAAIALFFIFAGAAAARGWSLVLSWHFYRGQSIQGLLDIESRIPVSLAAAFATLLGAACLARVFAPARWGHWAWILGIPGILALTWIAHLLLNMGRA